MSDFGAVAFNANAINRTSGELGRATRTSALSIAHSATLTGSNVTWQALDVSAGGTAGTPGTDLYAYPPDWYQLDVCLTYEPNATGVRVLFVDIINTALADQLEVANKLVPASPAGFRTTVDLSLKIRTTDPTGSFFRVRTAQNSGAALSLNASYTWATWQVVQKG